VHVVVLTVRVCARLTGVNVGVKGNQRGQLFCQQRGISRSTRAVCLGSISSLITCFICRVLVSYRHKVSHQIFALFSDLLMFSLPVALGQ